MKIQTIFKHILTLFFLVSIFACGKNEPRTFTNPPITNQDEWIVNVNDYQNYMTVVAEIQLDGDTDCNGSNILAAFSGTEVRGVVEPYEHLDCVLYNLIIYSNTAGDAITFGAYLSDENRTVSCTNEIIFEAGVGLGSPDTPYIIEIK